MLASTESRHLLRESRDVHDAVPIFQMQLLDRFPRRRKRIVSLIHDVPMWPARSNAMILQLSVQLTEYGRLLLRLDCKQAYDTGLVRMAMTCITSSGVACARPSPTRSPAR